MNKPYLDKELLCLPCAHCGNPANVSHQDYIGDYYVGDQYSINCSHCKIGIDYCKWEEALTVWNRRGPKAKPCFWCGGTGIDTPVKCHDVDKFYKDEDQPETSGKAKE